MFMLQPDVVDGVISPLAWKIIAAMAGGYVAIAIAWVKRENVHAKKIEAVYEARIGDLKAPLDLVDTLVNVLDPDGRKRGGGA